MSSNSDQNRPVVLVDGSSYLFRAFHAMPPLTNSKGQPTGAVKGVINMMRSLEQQYRDSEIIVVFDAKGPTFRHEQYPEYKANRPPMPDELRVQIEPIHEIIKAKGYPLLCVSGVEADDVIGTLAMQATEHGLDCVISTGDKDMAQLVNAHVSLINTMKNELLDVEGVTNKYGFGPDCMIDYLALMGDKVDNIPGVPGVGEKTATALITGLGGIDNIYNRLDEIAGLTFRGAKTMSKKLEEHKELAYLSYQLATIKCDVELEFGLKDLQQTDPDNSQLLALYTEQEFRSWINEVSDGAVIPAAKASNVTEQISSKTESKESTVGMSFPEQCEVACVVSMEGLQKLISDITQAGIVAISTVRNPGHYLQQRPLGISLCYQPGQAFYVPFQSNTEDSPTLLDEYLCMAKLKPVLENYSIKKIGHDLKTLRHQLLHYGVKPSHLLDDIWLKAFTYNSTLKRHGELDKHYTALGVDSLVRHYLDWSPTTYADIAGPFGAKQTPALDIAIDQLTTWAGEQADCILRMNIWFNANLSETSDLGRLYSAIEAPLIPVLHRVEQNGALLDSEYLQTLTDKFTRRMEQLEVEAHAEADQEFNLGSPKQLGVVLFEKMGLPVIQKTATGQPSTNEEVLSELALNYELPKKILEHRHLNKLVGTYTAPLPKMVNSDTGRVHTSYNQAGAATGRFSSNEPNLQNIPIRSPEGRAIRQAFIAPKGIKLVAADYSQVELRIMTHLSQDETLIAAFNEGKDIHRATAAEIMGIEEDQVTTEQRRSAKAINFGLIYGMSAFGLAKQLGIGRKEANGYVEAYFERYPGVRRYMDETRVEAAEKGYVETLYGRRLYLPDINSSKQMLKKAAERTAINAPMQGTAADIIKRAMVDVQAWLDGSRMQAKMIMQVHDELVFEVPEEQVDEFIIGCKMRMQHAADLDVPLIVDVGVGDNWDEAH